MHFAVADLHKWRSMDCQNHWIACETQDPWSPRAKHETTFGVMLLTVALKKINSNNSLTKLTISFLCDTSLTATGTCPRPGPRTPHFFDSVQLECS